MAQRPLYSAMLYMGTRAAACLGEIYISQCRLQRTPRIPVP